MLFVKACHISTQAAWIRDRWPRDSSSRKNVSSVVWRRSRPNHTGSPLSRLLTTVRNLGPFVDLVLKDSIPRPTQNLREVVVLHPRSLPKHPRDQNPRLAGGGTDSCSEPINLTCLICCRSRTRALRPGRT